MSRQAAAHKHEEDTRPFSGAEIIMRAAAQRRHSAMFRIQAAEQRVLAAEDRRAAEADRRHAAAERALAAADRDALAAQLRQPDDKSATR